MNFFLEDIKKNILLYLSLFILISNYMLFTAFNWSGGFEFEILKLILRLISFVFLLVFIFHKKIISKNLLILTFFTIIFYVINKNEIILNILFIFMIFACMYDIKIKNLLVFIFLCYIYYFLVHNILFYSGIILNADSFSVDRSRESFGFSNVNRLGIFYFYFFILSFYFFIQKNKFFKYFSLIFLCTSIYYILASDSRTALYCSILLYSLYVFKKITIFIKLQRFVLNFIILIGALFSLYLASASGQVWNQVLSMRPYFFEQYFNTLLIGYNFWLGSPVPEEITVDNSYILFFGAYGIFFSFLFCLVSPLLSINKKINPTFASMNIVILLYGIFESNLLRVEMLVPIFVFYSIFFASNRNN